MSRQHRMGGEEEEGERGQEGKAEWGDGNIDFTAESVGGHVSRLLKRTLPVCNLSCVGCNST